MSCKEKVTVESQNINEIYAEVNNYDGKAASLNIMGYFVDPLIGGTIDDGGKVNLSLPTNFDKVSQDAFDAYNAISESGYELSPIGIEDIFSPLESLDIKGERPRLALAGKYYGFEVLEQGVKIGRVFPASSKEFMRSIMNPEKYDPLIGYHYMFIYSDGPISINGSNEAPLEIDENGNTTLAATTSYEVELKEGWNVVKYEVYKIIKDKELESHVSKSAFLSYDKGKINEHWCYMGL